MKTLLIIISMLLFFTINSCSQNEETARLLNNKVTRQEVFNSIQNNHDLMNEFMQNAKGNQHAMMMMQGNNQMMGQTGQMGMNNEQKMMGKSYMMDMMHNNPEMMQMMMNNMVSVCATDSVMSGNLLHTMAQYPLMMRMMRNPMNYEGKMGTHDQGMMMNGNIHQMNMNSNKQK